MAVGKGLIISDDCNPDTYKEIAINSDINAIYLDGYFQNVRYFVNFQDQIKRELNYFLNKGIAPYQDLKAIIENRAAPKVSIHL